MRRSRALVVVLVLLVGAGLGSARSPLAPAGASGLARIALAQPVALSSAQPSASHAIRPVDGPVVRHFDPPDTPYGAGHRGVDLQAPPGTRVRAAAAGTVAFAGSVAGRGWVTVDHGEGLDTTYGWLDPLQVRRGDRVDVGQVLGLLAPDAGHLDWGARLHGAYIDPLGLLGPWRARLVPEGVGADG